MLAVSTHRPLRRDDARHEILLQTEPSTKGIFNLYINQTEDSLYTKDYETYAEAQKKLFNTRKSKIPNEIAAYLIALMNNETIPKPTILDKVVIANAEDFEIRLSESYITKQLTSDKILARIKAKEEKLQSYLTMRNLKYCWLLMVVEGISSKSSYEIIQENLPSEQTRFDQVFILINFYQKFIIQSLNDFISITLSLFNKLSLRFF